MATPKSAAKKPTAATAKTAKTANAPRLFNKELMVTELANRSNINKSDAGTIFENMMSIISERLAAGDRVLLNNLGTLTPVATEERIARNPKTGEPVQVPAGVRVKFSPASSLKSLVNAAE